MTETSKLFYDRKPGQSENYWSPKPISLLDIASVLAVTFIIATLSVKISSFVTGRFTDDSMLNGVLRATLGQQYILLTTFSILFPMLLPKYAKKLNGLNKTQMVETIGAIKAQPTLARFQFRNRNQWIDGGENRSTIQGFYGAGREDDSRTKPFVFVNGEPPVLLGEDRGPNPVEYALSALSMCMTTGIVYHAAAHDEILDEIVKYGPTFSPVHDIFTNSVPVEVTRDKS